MTKMHLTFAAALILNLSMAHAADFEKGMSAYEAGDYTTALAEFTELASIGNAQAQFRLGLMHGYGRGTEANSAESVRWITLAAEQGLAPAQHRLGRIYHWGDGVDHDVAEAVKWYMLAAEQGYADAQYSLAGMYREGRGVEEDIVEAAGWYKLAAEQGLARAQYSLSKLYFDGRGVEQNFTLAYIWSGVALRNGYAGANLVHDDAAQQLVLAKALSKEQAIIQDCISENYQNCGVAND